MGVIMVNGYSKFCKRLKDHNLCIAIFCTSGFNLSQPLAAYAIRGGGCEGCAPQNYKISFLSLIPLPFRKNLIRDFNM